ASAAIGAIGLFAFLPGLTTPARVSFLVAMAGAGLLTLALCLQCILIVRSNFFQVALVQAVQPTVVAIGTLLLWVMNSLTIESLMYLFAMGAIATLATAALCARISSRGARVRTTLLIREGYRYAGSQIAEVGANAAIP